MIGFRPLPALTAATAAALALLLTLGFWQLDRAEQKRALVAQHAAAGAVAPFDDLHAAVCAASEGAVGVKVVAPSTPLGEEVRFFGARSDGEAGWRLLRLTPAPDCRCDPAAAGTACLRRDLSIAVETGFETLAGERTAAPALLDVGPPPRPNVFTPENSLARGELFRFDPADLAVASGAPGQVESSLWLTAHAPGLPPGLASMPPSRHVGYALTWFGLALTLVVVYLAYHHRVGRLGR